MFIVAILGWWYGVGWKQRIAMLKERLMSTVDYFSIGLLFKTLFSPFRQISAGRVNGSLSVQLHAFFDRLISRCIGAFVRFSMIIIGSVAIIIHILLGIAGLVLWAITPVLPLIGLWLFLTGWIPWNL